MSSLVSIGPDIGSINPSLAEPRYTVFAQIDPDQVAFSEAKWSGSTLFVNKYMNWYQQPVSCYLIGWKLEVGMAS